MHEDVGFGSWLAHGGESPPGEAAVVPGIPVTTTFRRDADYALVDPTRTYLRDESDLVRRTEAVIARLEGAAATRLFGSGMAAISAVMRTVRSGGRVLMQTGIYHGTSTFTRRWCEERGVDLVEIDTTASDAPDRVAEAGADLVWIEVPSNPMLGITDVAAVARAAHAGGGLLAVDATPATPLGLRPLGLGADLVVHSATKALNGHSDLLGGVVSTADADLPAWASIVRERAQAGAVIGQFEAWLLLRGLRTLHLRHARMTANAATIAEALFAHPEVHAVLHPSLPSHPGADVHRRQADDAGALLSFRVRGGADRALEVVRRLHLVVPATSLGGTESLVEHRASVQDGVPDDLLRLSVGIEDVEDLLADLEHALRT